MSAIVKGSSFRRQRAISALRKLSTPQRAEVAAFVSREMAQVKQKRRAAALKAWETMRARKAAGVVPGAPPKLYSIIHRESECAPNLTEAKKYEDDSTELQSQVAADLVARKDPNMRGFLEGRGYEYLGSGISRAGVAIIRKPTCVLKFAYTKEGQKGNNDEVKVYQKTTDPNVKRLLLPVVAHSGRENWILMPRVSTASEYFAAGEKEVRIGDRTEVVSGYSAGPVMKAELAKHGAFIPDLHRENVGVTSDGRLIILDYGFGISSVEKAARLQAAARTRVHRRHEPAIMIRAPGEMP